MLGRLLEFSIASTDILASYEFYRSLGYSGLDSADVYPHRYGVVSDGRIVLGLHEADLPALALTYVHPDLSRHARALRDAGVPLSIQQLSDDNFNELSLTDPSGLTVRLLEARTFSPGGALPPTLTGWFEELAVPARDLALSAAFWERLGFIRMDDEPGFATLTSDHLSLTLHAAGVTPRPWLRFSVDDLEATRTRLDVARHRFRNASRVPGRRWTESRRARGHTVAARTGGALNLAFGRTWSRTVAILFQASRPQGGADGG